MVGSNNKTTTGIAKFLNFGEAITTIGACLIGLFYIFIGIGNSTTMVAIGVMLLVVGIFMLKFRKKLSSWLERFVNKNDR